MRPDVSVIIPVYNEAQRLPDSQETLLNFLNDFDHETELLFVDDGSTDGTADLVRAPARLIRNEENRGKGAAVRQGMLEASGQMRVFTDVDLAVPPRYLHEVLNHIENGEEIVVASRRAKGARNTGGGRKYRQVMGVVFNCLVRMLTVKGVSDTQCGFKAFTGAAADLLFSRQKLEGFAFDVELLYMASRFGFRIKEMPVEWEDSNITTIRPFVDASLILKDMLRIRKLHAGEEWNRF
ncbi:MAG: glycosyltransferase family 2 protein [Planctomycetota bacterium]|jgi:dolichyl-phosphate beta-glucosyltransferase|nr:glycosyltransferase family 2 protein [Planctomycetota bacterium]MDP6504297.1 glycosyltransferase family 2 protein [Planctomycetota bacterium]